MSRATVGAMTLALVALTASGVATNARSDTSPRTPAEPAIGAAYPLTLVADDQQADAASMHRQAGDIVRKASAREAAAVAAAVARRNAALRAARAAVIRAARASRAKTRPAIQPKVIRAGDPRGIARAMLSSFGWSAAQFGCLDPLWTRESGWRVTAANLSGAYGIPQALPGSKMAAYGSDWRTSARTQITWGLHYIAGRYASPCAAWQHFQATGWY